jgi:acyl carrier protein
MENTSVTKQQSARARKIVAGAIGVPENDLPGDAAIGQWGPWDSLAHMRIIMALEDDLGVILAMTTVVEISNLTDIEKLYSEHREA